MSNNSNTKFIDAVKRGDRALAASLIDSHPELVNATYDQATPLHFAALENQRELVELLSDAGADLNARDAEFNMTSIRWANEKGHTEMVRYLFERGAMVDLYTAVACGLIETVKEILQKDGSQINSMNHYGTPIHEASLWGHAELVQLLLEHGADPNITNVHGDNALEIARKQVASNCENTPIVINTRRNEIERGCREVIEVLLKNSQ